MPLIIRVETARGATSEPASKQEKKNIGDYNDSNKDIQHKIKNTICYTRDVNCKSVPKLLCHLFN